MVAHTRKPRQPRKPRGSQPPVRIVMKHRGVLGAFGYRDVKHIGLSARRAALRRAAAKLGWLYLIRKLNALYVYNKHRYPGTAALFRQNRNYASAQHRQTR